MTELNDQNVKIFVQNCINCSYHSIEVKPMNTITIMKKNYIESNSVRFQTTSIIVLLNIKRKCGNMSSRSNK